ncbi:hypothetical protein [Sporosarcina highlanderae]|uniref:Uncharacterized protein n=1 Tax=Sporosarcina highlanderae TaxID=3035916 RepID=A0ABT8JR05_9BACL|nr:hypothetical protein [Sporosarcina highlanderae]MDN4606614.1 hypothetical protein [Sporosarcina highlanderae]
MNMNSELNNKINVLHEDKRYILHLLMNEIEKGKPVTVIEDMVLDEVRQIIKEGE